MSEIRQTQTATSRWGWGILIAISALLVLNGVFLFFYEVAQSDQNVGLLLAGVGLFALVLSIGGYRQGSSLAWKALWVLVLTLTTVATHILVGGSTGLGVGYLVIAVIVAVGLLLARSGFGRSEPTAATTGT